MSHYEDDGALCPSKVIVLTSMPVRSRRSASAEEGRELGLWSLSRQRFALLTLQTRRHCRYRRSHPTFELTVFSTGLEEKATQRDEMPIWLHTMSAYHACFPVRSRLVLGRYYVDNNLRKPCYTCLQALSVEWLSSSSTHLKVLYG